MLTVECFKYGAILLKFACVGKNDKSRDRKISRVQQRDACGIIVFEKAFDEVYCGKKRGYSEQLIEITEATYLGTKISMKTNCIIIIQVTENYKMLYHKSMFQLNHVCEQHNMKLSTAKTKVMTVRGKGPVKTKLIINNQTTD